MTICAFENLEIFAITLSNFYQILNLSLSVWWFFVSSTYCVIFFVACWELFFVDHMHRRELGRYLSRSLCQILNLSLSVWWLFVSSNYSLRPKISGHFLFAQSLRNLFVLVHFPILPLDVMGVWLFTFFETTHNCYFVFIIRVLLESK